MSEQAENIMTPVGRLVSGSVHEPQKKVDPKTNQPKLDAAGNQEIEYYIGVAIPKGNETHWGTTDWGQIIWATGFRDFPGGENSRAKLPNFHWKIIDGDSAVPNQKNITPVSRDGYPGNWVVSFKTNFAPQMVNATGQQAIGGNEFYRGCYVQVLGTVKGNDRTDSPGVYLNTQIVALSGHGDRISTGPDAASAGFGQAPAPQAMSQVPIAQNVAAAIPQEQPVVAQPAPTQPTQNVAPVEPTNPHPQVMAPPPPVQQ